MINSISSHALPVLALLIVFFFQIFHLSLKKLVCGIKTTQKSHTFWNKFRSKQPINPIKLKHPPTVLFYPKAQPTQNRNQTQHDKINNKKIAIY